MKSFGNLLKQAKKVQEQMAKIQEELAKKKIKTSSGGGMVIVEANGQQEIISVVIEPEVINPDEKEMLQDLVLAAVNEALRKSKELMKEEIGKTAGGLGLPPGLL